jgi:hypothetical protein
MLSLYLLPFLLAAPPEELPEHPQARALVTKLGDDQFRVREYAFRELKKLGLAAIPALMDGLKDTDSERTTRCRKLLPAVEWWKNRTLLKFVLQPESPAPKELPELEAFLKLTGDSQASRELYAEMETAHPQLLAERRGATDLVDEIFSEHRQQSLSVQGSHWCLQLEEDCFKSRAGVTLYLYLASTRVYDTRYVRPKREATPLAFPDLGEALRDSAPLRKLYFEWVLREPSWYLKRQALDVALWARLEDTLPLLPRLITTAKTESDFNDVAQLLLLVRHYASPEAKKTLKPLLESSVLLPNRVPLSDVALGVILLSQGQSLRSSGFQTEEKGVLTLEDFRFGSEADRGKAMKRLER